MRKYIDLIRDANWNLLSETVGGIESTNVLEGGAMAHAQVSGGSDEINDTNEWIIKVASRRYIQEGKSVAEARAIVLSAFDSPVAHRISIDDL